MHTIKLKGVNSLRLKNTYILLVVIYITAKLLSGRVVFLSARWCFRWNKESVTLGEISFRFINYYWAWIFFLLYTATHIVSCDQRLERSWQQISSLKLVRGWRLILSWHSIMGTHENGGVVKRVELSDRLIVLTLFKFC